MFKNFRRYLEGFILGTNNRAAPTKSVFNLEGEKIEQMMIDFQQGLPENPNFRQINDVVMGGRSTGQISWDKDAGAALFSGVLSTENYGGFSSVRSQPWDGLSVQGSEGLKILVKGDGRLYKFNARMDSGYDGVSYQRDFKPASEWTEVSLKFSEFKPNFRGKVMPIDTPLQGDKIQQIGFMVSKLTEEGGKVEDFAPGPFQLFIKWVKFF
eukprot:TRINITY_DN5774_c0_g1_i3.p1 TRINITY_DN5774_c0_g1~~TRINITY_DN5774_c0_g1_i3.p1  ORF type:complete len:211 (-),score=38.10 TRINITY_DN5774_c0_g1_i3:157-789(-)